MLLPIIALALMIAHLMVADAAQAQCVGFAVQAVCVMAVYRQWRRALVIDRPLWLLLAATVGIQLLWTSCNLLALSFPGSAPQWIKAGVIFSGLSMVPALYLVAHSFHGRRMPLLRMLDALLAVTAAGLLVFLVQLAMSPDMEGSRQGALMVVNHADTISLLLASMATLRLYAAGAVSRRHLYLCATVYLWANGAVAAIYNRIEMDGLPWWGGVLIDLPPLLLILTAALPRGIWLRRTRPSLQGAELIAAFAPIGFSLAVLLQGISVSRVSYAFGMLAATLAVVVYGVQLAVLHRQHLAIQDATRRSNRALRQQVARDPLTGIANRIGLETHIRAASLKNCSLLMLDIDKFKQYNDALGHVRGDACLVEVATTLANALRVREANVARYGGEEFVVLLPGMSAALARGVAMSLLQAVERRRIRHPEGEYGVVTISIGIATGVVMADGGLALLQAADTALYRAKDGGRNRCVHADDIDSQRLETSAET